MKHIFKVAVAAMVLGVLGLMSGCSGARDSNMPSTAEQKTQQEVSDLLDAELPRRTFRLELGDGPHGEQRCVYETSTGHSSQMGPSTLKDHTFLALFPVEKGVAALQLVAGVSPDGWLSSRILPGGAPADTQAPFDVLALRKAIEQCTMVAQEVDDGNAPALNNPIRR